MNTFRELKIGQRFTWQNAQYPMVKTGENTATYPDGKPVYGNDIPDAFRTVRKLRKPIAKATGGEQ